MITEVGLRQIVIKDGKGQLVFNKLVIRINEDQSIQIEFNMDEICVSTQHELFVRLGDTVTFDGFSGVIPVSL